MQNIDRRSALNLGLAAAATTAMVKTASAQTAPSSGAAETSPAPGVVVRTYGEEHSLIPSFKTVVMRDVILQPGAKTQENTEMMNAMVCHIAEGELRVVQDGKPFTAKKNYVWTCNTGTKEHVINETNAVAIMRITDLKA
jgi:quercetin dioxygenase-like cupin family protein